MKKSGVVQTKSWAKEAAKKKTTCCYACYSCCCACYPCYPCSMLVILDNINNPNNLLLCLLSLFLLLCLLFLVLLVLVYFSPHNDKVTSKLKSTRPEASFSCRRTPETE